MVRQRATQTLRALVYKMATYNSSVIRDGNRIPVWWGISSTDGVTLVPIQVSSTTGGVMMDIGTSTMPVMSILPQAMPRDGNRIPLLCGVSSTVATTVLPVSVDPVTGAIQAQTT